MSAIVDSADEIHAWPVIDGWHRDPATATRVQIGNWATIGDGAVIGDGAKIGDGATTLDLAEQIRASHHGRGRIRAWKWITQDRMSPNFDGGEPVHYPIGATVEAEGEANDQQCGPGLHVLRVGVRPEWVGLCPDTHDLICAEVEFDAEDILFAGLPGCDAKWRVRKLVVVT